MFRMRGGVRGYRVVAFALALHDADDPEVPIEHLFSLITACAERPLQLHVTQGLGHHRLLGDRSVIERVVGFIEAPAY
mgnify:CR=1 FL=1